MSFKTVSAMSYFKRVFIILILSAAFLGACNKKSTVRIYGTDTIYNIVHQDVTYFYYGFSFSQAKLVSTDSNPQPDIVLYLDENDTPSKLILQANNFLPSFFKIGEYANEDEAKKTFDNLKTVPEPQQWLNMADPVASNQVWVYRSSKEKYTKFRIVKIEDKVEQGKPYAECTFQWVHQPDGSVNFQ